MYQKVKNQVLSNEQLLANQQEKNIQNTVAPQPG